MTAAPAERTLRRLQLIVGLQWMGATLGLPLLPLFLRHRGGTPSVIGLIMGSFFVGGLVTQFAVGHLSDRFGRRPVLVAALALYGIASAVFLLPLHAVWFTPARVLQGVAAGAIEVTALSTISGLFPEHERGRAVSRIYSAQLLGTALGPMLGVAISVGHLGWAFFFTGLASVAASFGAFRSLGRTNESEDRVELPPLQWSRQIIGSLVGAASLGLCIGVYEACWSLLMNHLGGSTTQIRLSWTFFCIPWVLMSHVGGKVADRFDRRKIVIAGMTNAALFLALYPHIHNVDVLLVIGSAEAVGAALTMPAASSMLTQGAHDRELGRRQGLSAMAQTSALALSSALAGTLFSVNPSLPFTVTSITSLTLTATLVFWWAGIPGRVTHNTSATP